jgi:hypothetical protein
MRKTQQQIVEWHRTIQGAIEQELKAIDDRLGSGEGGDCSDEERQRWGLVARIAVMDRVLERAEVRNSKRLFQYLTWQRQTYRNMLTDQRAQSEQETRESVPHKEPDAVKPGFTPVTQHQIEAVLNPAPVPFRQMVAEWFKGWRDSFGSFSSPLTAEWFLPLMEEEIRDAENNGRLDKDWERLTDMQKQVRILEKKILNCEKAVALGVHANNPEILRYALRAKECYTVYLDALKMDLSSS